MPVIARFYGIVVKMYFNEHGVPHFHAVYGEYNGVFDIKSLENDRGRSPAASQKACQGVGQGISGRIGENVEKTRVQATPRP